MHREPEVVDVWYDSGAMPFAQDHHPFATGGELAGRVPADFICEALDQTRGWFYSLLAESTLLFDETAYRNVVCLGLILDAEGQKMSKSKGNVIEPWTVLDRQGADAFRWYLLTAQSPWDSFRFSLEAVNDAMRRFLLTLWNTHTFLVTYASLPDGWTPGGPPPEPEALRPVDRWILSRLDGTMAEVTERLEAFDATGRRPGARGVPRRPQQLVRAHLAPPLLGRRGARGPRARPTATRPSPPSTSACPPSRCWWRPFCPFVAEEMLRHAGRRPRPVGARERPPGRLAASRRPARPGPGGGDGLARARPWPWAAGARAEAKLKVRQPLAEAVVACPTAVAQQIGSLVDLVAEELNVRSGALRDRPRRAGGRHPQAQLPPPRAALRQAACPPSPRPSPRWRPPRPRARSTPARP